MSYAIFRRDNCRLCGGRDLELVLQLTPTPIGADYVSAERLGRAQECYPLDLFLCLTCGYVGLWDVVDPEVFFGGSTDLTSMSLGLTRYHKRNYHDVDHLRRYSDEENVVHGADVDAELHGHGGDANRSGRVDDLPLGALSDCTSEGAVVGKDLVAKGSATAQLRSDLLDSVAGVAEDEHFAKSGADEGADV